MFNTSNVKDFFSKNLQHASKRGPNTRTAKLCNSVTIGNEIRALPIVENTRLPDANSRVTTIKCLFFLAF